MIKLSKPLNLFAILSLSAFSNITLVTSTANAFKYYTEGAVMYVKSWTDNRGVRRYNGCGPVQCAASSYRSAEEVLNLISGSEHDGSWEPKGEFGSCQIWVSTVAQGTYPSINGVLEAIKKNC